jgi:WD40 repeat protein
MKSVEGINPKPLSRIIAFNNRGEILYFVGNFGVIFSQNFNSQRVYARHEQEICFLNTDCTNLFAVTGAKKGECHIWDALTATHIVCFDTFLVGDVIDACFSKGGSYLVAVSSEVFHSLGVFYSPSGFWNDGFYLCGCSVSSLPSYSWLAFVDSYEYPIIVGGGNCLSYFKIKNGVMLQYTQTVSSNEKPVIMEAAVVVDLPSGDLELTRICLVCASNIGYLYIVDEMKTVTHISAHDRPIKGIATVNSSSFSPSQAAFATVSEDSKVKVWSRSLKVCKVIDLLKLNFTREVDSRPESIVFNRALSTFVLVYQDTSLFEMSSDLSSIIPITESHSFGRINGGAFNPSNDFEYITVGQFCFHSSSFLSNVFAFQEMTALCENGIGLSSVVHKRNNFTVRYHALFSTEMLVT